MAIDSVGSASRSTSPLPAVTERNQPREADKDSDNSQTKAAVAAASGGKTSGRGSVVDILA